MELKATSLGKRLAQHPYNRVRLLPAGVEVSGDRHEYIIPFNQLLGIECKRGMVWGELEFQLADNQVVRLHGTEWQETQQFYQHLSATWRQWSDDMAAISFQVLNDVHGQVMALCQRDRWLTRREISGLRETIEQGFASVPLPEARLSEFDDCRPLWAFCKAWLEGAEVQRQERNRQWSQQVIERYPAFFSQCKGGALNPSQCQAVVNGEDNLLVLAGAGSGKTSVLVARTAWLIERQAATPEQILLLSFGREAAQELSQRLQGVCGNAGVTTFTFHSLALEILRQGSNKSPKITELESDEKQRRELLTRVWQQQCAEKKSAANGWRQWLQDELQWPLPEGPFWESDTLANRLAVRLERWLALMREHGGAQAAMIEQAPEEIRVLFGKRLRLMAPLLKAWKSHIKQESAVDFSGLIHQAIALLEKGRFISPWKHILVDEFQDISPQRAALLQAIRKQNRHSSLFAVGDDWQAIYRFTGADLNLTTRFHDTFGEGDVCVLETSYRFNQRIGDTASRFIQQNPAQLKKALDCLEKGNKKSIVLMSDDQLEALINKMSGYVSSQESILILARYHYLKPTLLSKAATRWPGLAIRFMTFHSSKGKEADYVIVLGLNEGTDGFPAPSRDSVIEQGLLPEPESFPDAEERRLAYVAMTRARQQLWLLFDKSQPSVFVEELKRLGVPVQRKP